MFAKKSKIIIAVVVVVVIIAAVVVGGFVVNQPHYGFASTDQINSDVGHSFMPEKFNITNTYYSSIGNKSNGGVSNKSMKYVNYKNDSTVSDADAKYSIFVIEIHFSSASKATHAYSGLVGDSKSSSTSKVNATYSSFTYSEFGNYTYVFAHRGTYLVTILLDDEGLHNVTQSDRIAVFHSIISSMTSFNL